MESIPPDPWGNEYQYAYPGEANPNSYDIWSYGPDGSSGTDDDIGNWGT
jgi:general secretion pathway protein G